MNHPSRWRRVLKILLFLLIIDGTLLALAEAAAYVFSPTYYRKVASAQKLSAAKPDHLKRIFVFGESTIDGFPYPAENNTAHWLQIVLTDVLPTGIEAQVVNFGKPARCAIHLRQALEHTLAYKPDLVILCLGHNEFLARSLSLSQNPTHRWWYLHSNLYRGLSDVVTNFRSRRMEKTGIAPGGGIPADGPLHQDVAKQFGEEVDQMVVACQKAKVPILLCIPGSNLVCRPAFSQGVDLHADRRRQRDGLIEEANAKLLRGEQADAEIEQALHMDPHWALTHYWKGRNALLAGDRILAREAMQAARDWDALPFRCQTPLQSQLKTISQKRQVPLIDFPSVFQSQQDAPPGSDWFVDSCHPRPWGQHLMAVAMAKALAENRLLGESASWRWSNLPDFERCMSQMKSPASAWSGPERRALLTLMVNSPEVAWDLAQRPPVLWPAEDKEWQTLKTLSLWMCGRKQEALKLASECLIPDDRTADWPDQVKQAWSEFCEATRSKPLVQSRRP